MRRGVAVPLLALTLALLGAAAAVARADRHHHPMRHTAVRLPTRMLVYSQEWSLWPSRRVLPSGTVDVQLWNRGQDAHDLTIQRIGAGGALLGLPQVLPATLSGQVVHGLWRLRPGHYELYCSLPQHRQRGMHARLTVR